MKCARVQLLVQSLDKSLVQSLEPEQPDLPSLMSPAQAHAFLAAEQSRYAPVASRIKPE